ncbi:MAG: hypothetical protein GX542_08585, partial [Rhodococcus sp.]|nr:hypothetical protein [Rhodococcus sp. (in: high G+C Gram-positive bacteria)]
MSPGVLVSAHTHLSFGTAGLRGPVQEGPDGMNNDLVARATSALATWLHEQHG